MIETLNLQYTDPAPLDFPGVKFSSTGLTLPESLPFEQWVSIIHILPRVGDAVKWAIGDALNFGEHRYGEKYQQALSEDLGSYGVLRIRCHVAAEFQLLRRRNNVRWWVYQEIAPLPFDEQERMLDYAEQWQPTREQLREHLRPVGASAPLLFPMPTISIPQGVTEQQARTVLSALASSPEMMPARIEKAVKVLSGETTNIHVSDESYEWYTPDEYLEAARAVLQGIDLDPASSSHAQEMVKAGHFFTREDDGISQPWGGNVWLNPPYSSPDVDNFMDKLVREFLNGSVKAAIALTNNCTDTRWFHKTAEASSAICFTKGRIGFWKPEAAPLAARQGQVFFYLGNNPAEFARLFSGFGLVVSPYDYLLA